jgi:hypothetical protein
MLENTTNPKTGKSFYYKDNPEAVKKRDATRVYINGKEISKRNPMHKMFKAGRYKNINDAAFELSKLNDIVEGYVYAIHNPAWPEWIKIGKAIDSQDRLNGYQTSSPLRDYEIIHSVYFDNRNLAERKAHKIAERKGERSTAGGLKGEWFKLTKGEAIEVLEEIKND